MPRYTPYVAALAAGALLAACAPANSDNSKPRPLTERQSKILAKQLDGKIAGEPAQCINTDIARGPVRVSDTILLYRVSKKLVYRNNLTASCPGLASDSDIIVTEPFGGQHCKGDTIRLVDRSSGIMGGICRFGEFVPYRSVDAD